MSNSLFDITIDATGLSKPTEEVEREQQIAIFDLLQDNSFKIIARENQSTPKGPYHLSLAIRERRLIFSLKVKSGELASEIQLSLSSFRQVVKDYFQICESYFDAVKSLPASQIEAIDMARRGIHNEGAELLQERLEGKAIIDVDTARRLFTLIYILYFGS